MKIKKFAAVALAAGMMMPLMSGTVLAADHCSKDTNTIMHSILGNINDSALGKSLNDCSNDANAEGYSMASKRHSCMSASDRFNEISRKQPKTGYNFQDISTYNVFLQNLQKCK